MISKAYSEFFRELERNNNKEWFHANKKRYENEVKAPFLNLIQQLIPELIKMEPLIQENPKSALFRINRDVRFSKDKTPYHTLLKAGFSPEGKKSEKPGFYLGISADTIHLGGGLFQVKPGQLKAIRELVYVQKDAFKSILEDQAFKECFGALQGERHKRISPEFQLLQLDLPYIANKQFYVMRQTNLAPYLETNKIKSFILNHFKTVNKLNQFLNQAFE